MAVGPNERIWRERVVCLLTDDDAREVLEVELVQRAGAGWDDGDVGKCGVDPLQKGEALTVALEFCRLKCEKGDT